MKTGLSLIEVSSRLVGIAAPPVDEQDPLPSAWTAQSQHAGANQASATLDEIARLLPTVEVDRPMSRRPLVPRSRTTYAPPDRSLSRAVQISRPSTSQRRQFAAAVATGLSWPPTACIPAAQRRCAPLRGTSRSSAMSISASGSEQLEPGRSAKALASFSPTDSRRFRTPLGQLESEIIVGEHDA